MVGGDEAPALDKFNCADSVLPVREAKRGSVFGLRVSSRVIPLVLESTGKCMKFGGLGNQKGTCVSLPGAWVSVIPVVMHRQSVRRWQLLHCPAYTLGEEY